METVFLRILNMSITAGWVVLAVLVLRILLRKAPKAICCVLWAFVGIRLVCPFTIESALSLIPGTETVPEGILYAQEPVIETGVEAFDEALNLRIFSSIAPKPDGSVNPLQIVVYLASVLWLLGVTAMLLYAVTGYIRLRRRVRTAMRLEKDLWLCDEVKSPFILGIIRPRIYLPVGLSEAQLRFVVAHERAHLHRCDHWWKLIGFLILAVYWFHPFVWVSYILLSRDIELACDERLVRDMESWEKKSYAETLFACSMPRHRVSACPLAFGEVGVKARVKAVLNYKKPAFWGIVTAIVSCAGVVLCFLTDPVTGSGEEPQGQRADYDLDDWREQEDFAAGEEALDRKEEERNGKEDKVRENEAIEDAFETAVSAAIMENCGTDSASEYFCWAGHVIFSRQELSGSPLEGDAGNGKKVTAYCLAMYQELELFEESIEEKTFSYFPAAMTFFVDADGGYVLEEFWKPQGAGSMEALEAVLMEKFPMEVAEEVLEARRSQSFFDHLKQDCYGEAVEYGGVDTDKAVEGLLEVIESSPAWSSYSGSYLAEHPVEYHTLAYYGDYTVKYILAQFLKGGQTGLRGDLMITIVAGLTGEPFFGEYAGTGQEYFDAWMEKAKETETLHGMEWMKENRPYQWMALNM